MQTQENQTNEIVALIVSGGTGTVDTPATAIALRDALEAEAALIETVASDQANQIASDIVAKINGTEKIVELLRMDVGKPSRELLERINTAARDFLKPLLDQKKRLAGNGRNGEPVGLMTKYQIDKINAERLAKAERDKQLEDMARKEAELANAAANAATPAEARKIEVQRQQLASTPVAIAPVAIKAKGQSVAMAWDLEVLDAGEFYKAFPGLHKEPEVSYAAKNAALKNQITRKQLQECKFVRVFETVATNVRSK
jgi:hypothetical protein